MKCRSFHVPFGISHFTLRGAFLWRVIEGSNPSGPTQANQLEIEAIMNPGTKCRGCSRSAKVMFNGGEYCCGPCYVGRDIHWGECEKRNSGREGMNTAEVCAMIDAISDGKNYTLEITGDKLTGVAEIQFTPSRFYIKLAEGWGIEHENPRTAREIAGAFIAWATQKEIEQ